VASTLISWTYDHTYDPRQDLPRVRACLRAAAMVYERACARIQAVKPERVATFNGRFALSKPIVAAAEKHGVPVLRHERGATYDRYATFTDSVHNFAYINQRLRTDWQNADPVEREQLGHEYFQRRRKGDGVGWHSFIGNQQQGLTLARQSTKRQIVYYSSSDDEFAAIAHEHAPAAWPDQMSAVQDVIRACADLPGCELVIRIHPHLALKARKHREAWEALARDRVTVIRAEDPIDSYALLDGADIVITYGSKMGIEATYWGKPAILMGPCAYAGMDANYEPQSLRELALLLSAETAPPSKPKASSLPFGHYMLTFGTKFRFYQPESLSEGKFMGDRLGWDPDIVYALRKKSWIGPIKRYFTRRA
jgi:hypothetical protein